MLDDATPQIYNMNYEHEVCIEPHGVWMPRSDEAPSYFNRSLLAFLLRSVKRLLAKAALRAWLKAAL